MWRTVLVLWRNFFRICLFQLGPQHMPASYPLLAIVLFAYVALGVTQNLDQRSFPEAVLSGLLEPAVLILLTASLLTIMHYTDRIIQTLIALFGAALILSLLSLPLFEWVELAQNLQWSLELPIFFVQLLLIWNMGVLAHIFAQSLSSSFWIGLLVAFIFTLILVSIISAFFPAPPINGF